MKILMSLTAIVGLFFQVAAAATGPALMIQASPIVEATAKMANTGLMNIKEITKFEKVLVSDHDRKFLRSISYKPLLPKGYAVIPLMDRMIIVRDKQMVGGLQIVSVEPLIIKNSGGKSWTVDPRDVTGSLKIARFESESSEVARQLKALVLPSANAESTSDELSKRIAFILYLVKADYSKYNDGAQAFSEVAPRIRAAIKYFNLEGDVRCAGSTADLVVRSEKLKTHVTSDGSWREGLYCSKDVPDHKIFSSNENPVGYKDKYLDESCVDSDRPETIEVMTNQRAKLLSQVSADFAKAQQVKDIPGTLELNDGKCSIKFVEKPPFPIATLSRLTAEVGTFCNRHENVAKIAELDLRIGARRTFIEALRKHYTALDLISKQLAACCDNNNCRLKALTEGGMKLEHPESESTK